MHVDGEPLGGLEVLDLTQIDRRVLAAVDYLLNQTVSFLQQAASLDQRVGSLGSSDREFTLLHGAATLVLWLQLFFELWPAAGLGARARLILLLLGAPGTFLGGTI